MQLTVQSTQHIFVIYVNKQYIQPDGHAHKSRVYNKVKAKSKRYIITITYRYTVSSVLYLRETHAVGS